MLYPSELQCLTEWTGGPGGVPAAGAEYSTAPGSAKGPVLLAQILHTHTHPPQIRTASGLTQRFSKLLPGLCHLSATYRAETPVLRAKASSSGRGRGRGSGDASATVLSPVGRMYSKGSLQSFQNVNFTSTVLQKHDISRFNSWRFVILQRWGPERGRACL